MNNRKIAIALPFCLFVALGLGIVLGKYLFFFWAFFIGSVICLIAVVFFYRKNKFFLSDAAILLLFLLLGAGYSVSSLSLSADEFLNEDHYCKVKILSLAQEQGYRNAFLGKVEKIENIPVNLKARVFDYTRQAKYLNAYTVRAKLRRHQYRGGEFYYLWISKDAFLKQEPLNCIDKAKQKVTGYFLDIFNKHLSQEGYEFISSVFLGRKELLGQKKNVFAGAGASHLLAISGLHVAATAAAVFFILRFFHIKFRARLIFSTLFLSLYTLLTGPSSSTLRAAIMYFVFVLGFFFERRINPFNSLGIAGIISLIIEPLSLWDIGFQLSFLSVFALILGARLFPPKASPNIIVSQVKQILFCSLAVAVFITPVVSYYFGRVYLLAVFYNIVLIPFFTLILMINFIFIIFAPFVFIAQALGAVLSMIISVFINFSRVLGEIRGSFISYTCSIEGAAAYYLCLIVFLLVLRCRQGGRLMIRN